MVFGLVTHTRFTYNQSGSNPQRIIRKPGGRVATKPTAVARPITQKDVAQRAGVTTSSVSYVINNGPRSVSAETRERVLKAIQELEYRPNEHAQKAATGHHGSLAWC